MLTEQRLPETLTHASNPGLVFRLVEGLNIPTPGNDGRIGVYLSDLFSPPNSAMIITSAILHPAPAPGTNGISMECALETYAHMKGLSVKRRSDMTKVSVIRPDEPNTKIDVNLSTVVFERRSRILMYVLNLLSKISNSLHKR